MKYNDFRLKFYDYPLFKYVDILKKFPHDNELTIKQNLKFWVKKGLLERVVKGIYKFKEVKIEDEFYLASYLDQNSYVSLESALSFYGMIPEYPFSITSVTINKTKKISTSKGSFFYRKIKKELFFGFRIISKDKYFYQMALPEKALFDFIYLNQKQIKSRDYFQELRLFFPNFFSFKNFFALLKLLKNKKLVSDIKSYVDHK